MLPVRMLEQEIGYRLFNCLGKGIELTRDGEVDIQSIRARKK